MDIMKTWLEKKEGSIRKDIVRDQDVAHCVNADHDIDTETCRL